MLRTLHDLATQISNLRLPLKERVVVELHMKDGTTKQGTISSIRKPQGAKTVVIFAEE